jgi:GntR family transcriptional regulator, transcriptional repressor for pyruvate dehydrogenase complex
MTRAPGPPAARRGLPIVYRPGALFSPRNGAPAATRLPKISESTAAAIVTDIVQGGLGVGDRLPAESEMAERYAVSRESLREALRLLEVQGLITLKRGPGGGPLVSALNAGYLARTATMYFHLSGATYDELFETWQILEPPLSARVARVVDKEVKREVFGPFVDYDAAAHEHDDVFADLNNFHAVIADLSGNHVLTLLTQAVTHVVVSHVLDLHDPVSAGTQLAHSHSDIARAIISGHAVKSAVLMEAHISELTDTYREHFSDRMSETIAWM